MDQISEKDVFSLLTDERLQAIYGAARRDGSAIAAAASPLYISPQFAKFMLDGSYANVENPLHCLQETMARMRYKRRIQLLKHKQRQAQEARRRGDAELERQLVREILAIKKQVD